MHRETTSFLFQGQERRQDAAPPIWPGWSLPKEQPRTIPELRWISWICQTIQRSHSSSAHTVDSVDWGQLNRSKSECHFARWTLLQSGPAAEEWPNSRELCIHGEVNLDLKAVYQQVHHSSFCKKETPPQQPEYHDKCFLLVLHSGTFRG